MAKLTEEELQSEQERLTKEYNAAAAAGNVSGMQYANDEMNSIRIENGLEPQYATEHIANVQAQQNAAAGIKPVNAADYAAQYIASSGIPSTYTASSGISSTADAAPAYKETALPGVSNYSSYIEDMYKAKEDAALAGLEAAYQKNVTALDAAREEIAPAYQAARNQTAASSEQANRNFAEYAGASGLNSGASGQAELARGVTLQNNLGSLNQAEADAFSELDLQRAQVTSEYNAAIATARANGSYELAGALYQEAVRVEQSLISNALSQAGLDYNKWSADYTAWQDARNRSDTLAQQERAEARAGQEALAALGQLWLQYGVMPSDAALKAMNVSKEEAQAFIKKANKR